MTAPAAVPVAPELPGMPERPMVAIPADTAFYDQDFLDSDGLDRLASDVLTQWPELSWLRGYRVRVLWKRKGGEKGGRSTLGKCSVPSGVAKHFIDADWVIWLAADHARGHKFTPLQIEALLFHEMLHCVEKGDEDDPKPGVVGHDLEIFFGEIDRYGLWETDLLRAKAVFGQQALPGLT